jgi:hypothetical protein
MQLSTRASNSSKRICVLYLQKIYLTAKSSVSNRQQSTPAQTKINTIADFTDTAKILNVESLIRAFGALGQCRQYHGSLPWSLHWNQIILPTRPNSEIQLLEFKLFLPGSHQWHQLSHHLTLGGTIIFETLFQHGRPIYSAQTIFFSLLKRISDMYDRRLGSATLNAYRARMNQVLQNTTPNPPPVPPPTVPACFPVYHSQTVCHLTGSKEWPDCIDRSVSLASTGV